MSGREIWVVRIDGDDVSLQSDSITESRLDLAGHFTTFDGKVLYAAWLARVLNRDMEGPPGANIEPDEVTEADLRWLRTL